MSLPILRRARRQDRNRVTWSLIEVEWVRLQRWRPRYPIPRCTRLSRERIRMTLASLHAGWKIRMKKCSHYLPISARRKWKARLQLTRKAHTMEMPCAGNNTRCLTSSDRTAATSKPTSTSRRTCKRSKRSLQSRRREPRRVAARMGHHGAAKHLKGVRSVARQPTTRSAGGKNARWTRWRSKAVRKAVTVSTLIMVVVDVQSSEGYSLLKWSKSS